MLVKPPVLVADQHGEKTRIDVFDSRLQPPAPLRRGEGTQQFAIGIQHFARDRRDTFERRWIGAISPFKTNGHHSRQQEAGA